MINLEDSKSSKKCIIFMRRRVRAMRMRDCFV
jgi:hypothetical protein